MAPDTKDSPTPRITGIHLTPVHVPFTEQVLSLMQQGEGGLGMAIKAEKSWLGGDFVICQLFTDTGHCGLGEAFMWAPETGISPKVICTVMEEALAPYILGENPFLVNKIRYRMDQNLARNEVPKGIIDMACFDLMGQICQQPSHHFLGGMVQEKIPLCGLVPLTQQELMISLAQQFKNQGMQTLRIKLGRSVESDREIISNIRAAVGKNVRLRVDYNQAYRSDTAIRAIKAIEPFGIDYAEQPVPVNDFYGMAAVQAAVDTPLMAHESCFGLLDITTLIHMRAIRVIGINAERPGGVSDAVAAIHLARSHGMGVAFHNQPLGIGSAMMLHLATAHFHNLGHAVELLGHLMMEDDLIETPIDYSDGQATVPQGRGWGITLDRNALEKYQTAKTVVID